MELKKGDKIIVSDQNNKIINNLYKWYKKSYSNSLFLGK